jgi:hypothetical protein
MHGRSHEFDTIHAGDDNAQRLREWCEVIAVQRGRHLKVSTVGCR